MRVSPPPATSTAVSTRGRRPTVRSHTDPLKEPEMDALELLVGRESAVKLSSPGPDHDALEVMFQSALRAPDHGRLRPWRFVVVPEEKRERFGELMADCLRRMDANASAEMLQRERDKAMRAPVIVVVAATVQRGHKIAEVEQLASAAAATENIMLAARALGFG